MKLLRSGRAHSRGWHAVDGAASTTGSSNQRIRMLMLRNEIRPKPVIGTALIPRAAEVGSRTLRVRVLLTADTRRSICFTGAIRVQVDSCRRRSGEAR